MCGSPPDAPQLPQFPDLTPQEQQILGQQGLSLDQYKQLISSTQGQLQQNQGILQQVSGLYNSDGSINQAALQKLQQQTQNSVQTQGAAGQSALNYLNSAYGYLGSSYAPNGIIDQTTQAYEGALSGKGPANQQLQFTQNQNFQAMKEQAAQQGIEINGDNWASAVSNSSAGQKLIQNYQQNANIQNNQYQLGYLGQTAQNFGALQSGLGAVQNGAASSGQIGANLSQGATSQPLGYVGQSITQGPSSLSPLLQNYQSGLSNYYQPYQTQQLGPYSQQLQQQQANYSAGLNRYNGNQNMYMGWANLGGQLIGSAKSGSSSGLPAIASMV